MRAICCISISLVALSFLAAGMAQERVSITIDEIVQDDHVTGSIAGLTSVGVTTHKVVVYVRTDQWYIHPYAQGGEGKSWASISRNGTWTIGTVRREIPSSSIAALVVPQDAAVQATARTVQAIPHIAIVVLDLEDAPDYGKL